MKSFIITFVLALLIHLTLGWMFTALAGVIVGVYVGAGAWKAGALGVGSAWAAIVAWNMIFWPAEMTNMFETMSAFIANATQGDVMPLTIAGLTILIGLLIGLFSALFGTRIHFLMADRSV